MFSNEVSVKYCNYGFFFCWSVNSWPLFIVRYAFLVWSRFYSSLHNWIWSFSYLLNRCEETTPNGYDENQEKNHFWFIKYMINLINPIEVVLCISWSLINWSDRLYLFKSDFVCVFFSSISMVEKNWIHISEFKWELRSGKKTHLI